MNLAVKIDRDMHVSCISNITMVMPPQLACYESSAVDCFAIIMTAAAGVNESAAFRSTAGGLAYNE